MKALIEIIGKRTENCHKKQDEYLDQLQAKETERRKYEITTDEYIAVSEEIVQLNAKIWNADSWRRFKRSEHFAGSQSSRLYWDLPSRSRVLLD